MTKILLLQGANMVWLGKREPALYGTTTADKLDLLMHERARVLGVELEIFYANIEGEAISRIYQGAKDGIDGEVKLFERIIWKMESIVLNHFFVGCHKGFEVFYG